MKKKLVGILLVSLLTLPMAAQAETSLADVSPRFHEEVNYLLDRGIVKGYLNGQFGANGKVTRAQAVAMIMREGRIWSVNTPDPGFTDMDGATGFYKEVGEAVKLGIIQGKIAEDGSKYFDPEGYLTRSEMALILTRAYNIPLDRQVIGFKDVPDTLSSSKAINAITIAGATLGYEDGTFKPYQHITREHFSVFLARLIEREFNPMGHQFIPDDELSLSRPPIEWLTDEERNVLEQEMIVSVNETRQDAGLSALKINDELMKMTEIKARGIAHYPNSDNAFNLIEEFYEKEYGVVPTGFFFEIVSSYEKPSDTIKFAGNTKMYKDILFDNRNDELGVGLAQDIDGGYEWVLFFWDKE
ncbi:MAG: S-layer homology domain-containing protein [Paenisporosarcina sp.]|nr:S-layer homology domain-containing protein [Paenisporosarcina sp.]